MAIALAQILKLTQIADKVTTVINGTSSVLVTRGPSSF